MSLGLTVISMSFLFTHASSIQKREEDLNINEPEKWINNRKFLIAAGTTCIALLVIFGPLIAWYIYRKRKASGSMDNDEDLNTVFKSSHQSKAGRNPRVSSMIMDEKRISGQSGFSYSFPSNQYAQSNQFAPSIQYAHSNYSQSEVHGDQTYSDAFRDSVIYGSLNEASVASLDSSSIPSPYDKIKLNHTYIVGRGYTASEFDEMNVKEGDIVIVHKVYEDGWVLCMNHENKNQGVIPSDCFDF